MPQLPRHLRDRFDSTTGNPITPSDTATPTPLTPPDTNAPTVTATVTPSPSSFPSLVPENEETGTIQAETLTLPDAPSSETLDAPTETDTVDVRWKRTEGRYKAEIGRLKDEIKDLKEQARSSSVLADILNSQIAELNEHRAKVTQKTPEPEKVTAPVAPTFELTKDEQELYGEFMPVADKLVSKAVYQATAPLLEKIANLEKQTGEVDKRTGAASEEAFHAMVRATIPQFDRTIQKEEWQQFVKQPVPYTNLTVGNVLWDAHQKRDLARINQIFDAFASQHAPTTAAVQTPATPANPSPSTNGLSQFATPGKTNTAPHKPSPQFSQQDYSKKLEDMRRGRLSKEDFMKFENQFKEAAKKGLVAQ